MLVCPRTSSGFDALMPKKHCIYNYTKSTFRDSIVKCAHKQVAQPLTSSTSNTLERGVVKKVGKETHHLWKKRDSAGSGQKALNLVRIVSQCPNEKEAVYGELNKWVAWETEFPLIAAAKALRILRKRSQWKRVIQFYYCRLILNHGHFDSPVDKLPWLDDCFAYCCHFYALNCLGLMRVAKWMLSKGQGATMATYDTLLLAFDMDERVDEAESLWNMILHTHTRSISKRLFSRMISLYDHHDLQNKIIEIFADMEELGVKPDEDTVRRVAHAFQKLGQEENWKMVYKRYGCKWKFIHFNGERVRVRRDGWEDEDDG